MIPCKNQQKKRLKGTVISPIIKRSITMQIKFHFNTAILIYSVEWSLIMFVPANQNGPQHFGTYMTG